MLPWRLSHTHKYLSSSLKNKQKTLLILNLQAQVLPRRLCFGCEFSPAPSCCFLRVFCSVDGFCKYLGKQGSPQHLQCCYLKGTLVELGTKFLLTSVFDASEKSALLMFLSFKHLSDTFGLISYTFSHKHAQLQKHYLCVSS